MKPIKIIKSNKKDSSFDDMTGLIMSDGITSELIYFDCRGYITNEKDSHIELVFDYYCKLNNLKIK